MQLQKLWLRGWRAVTIARRRGSHHSQTRADCRDARCWGTSSCRKQAAHLQGSCGRSQVLAAVAHGRRMHARAVRPGSMGCCFEANAGARRPLILLHSSPCARCTVTAVTSTCDAAGLLIRCSACSCLGASASEQTCLDRRGQVRGGCDIYSLLHRHRLAARAKQQAPGAGAAPAFAWGRI